MLRVEDVMTTNVLTLTANDTIGEADAEMRLGDFRHLPIVDERRHVVGMLSNRDVFRALGRAGRGKTVRVAEVMAREPHVVTPDTPAREAARLMLEKRIGALPVIGDDATLVGIVTETDFLALAYDMLSGEPPLRTRRSE